MSCKYKVSPAVRYPTRRRIVHQHTTSTVRLQLQHRHTQSRTVVSPLQWQGPPKMLLLIGIALREGFQLHVPPCRAFSPMRKHHKSDIFTKKVFFVLAVAWAKSQWPGGPTLKCKMTVTTHPTSLSHHFIYDSLGLFPPPTTTPHTHKYLWPGTRIHLPPFGPADSYSYTVPHLSLSYVNLYINCESFLM